MKPSSSRARQREPSALRDAHVLRAVLRALARAVEPVVVRRDGRAQLVDSAQVSVRVILGADRHRVDALGRAAHRPDFRLALSEIAPVGMTVDEAELHRLGDDEDHAHVGHFAQRSEVGRGLRGTSGIGAPSRGGLHSRELTE